SLTERGADVTFDALALGVVDFVTKPRIDVHEGLSRLGDEIRAKVRAAASARVRVSQFEAAPAARPAQAAAPRPSRHLRTTDRLIALGASTGGTEAIKELLCGLPADAPGVVIAQHIPPRFSAAFARRVDALTALTVK